MENRVKKQNGHDVYSVSPILGRKHTDTEDFEMAFHMHTPPGESSCCLYTGWI